MIEFLKYTVSLHNYIIVLLGVTLSQNFLLLNPASYILITLGISLYHIRRKRCM